MLERTNTSPDPYEPFLLSRGMRLGDLLLVSGRAGYDADGPAVEGSFKAQGKQAFANLRREFFTPLCPPATISETEAVAAADSRGRSA